MELKEFYTELYTMHENCFPELRFGQLFDNVQRESGSDLFYTSNPDILKKVETYAYKYGRAEKAHEKIKELFGDMTKAKEQTEKPTEVKDNQKTAKDNNEEAVKVDGLKGYTYEIVCESSYCGNLDYERMKGYVFAKSFQDAFDRLSKEYEYVGDEMNEKIVDVKLVTMDAEDYSNCVIETERKNELELEE